MGMGFPLNALVVGSRCDCLMANDQFLCEPEITTTSVSGEDSEQSALTNQQSQAKRQQIQFVSS